MQVMGPIWQQEAREENMSKKSTLVCKSQELDNSSPEESLREPEEEPAESQRPSLIINSSSGEQQQQSAGVKRKPAGQQASPRRRRRPPASASLQELQRQPQSQKRLKGAAGTGSQLARPREELERAEAEGAREAERGEAIVSGRPGEENICAGCQKAIKERYLLVALDKQWHEDCLKCACCDCRLGEVGSSLFTHSGKILCRRDFQRIFGQHGHCAVCKKSIPPYEMVMRANENAYHMDCFACQQCQYRFCVGDRFHLTDKHKIICILCHSDATLLGAGAHPNGQQQAGAGLLSPAAMSAPTSGAPQQSNILAEKEEENSSSSNGLNSLAHSGGPHSAPPDSKQVLQQQQQQQRRPPELPKAQTTCST